MPVTVGSPLYLRLAHRRTPTDAAHLWLLASEAPFDITNEGSDIRSRRECAT